MALPAFGTANPETCNGVKCVPDTHPILNRFDGTQMWELRHAEDIAETAIVRAIKRHVSAQPMSPTDITVEKKDFEYAFNFRVKQEQRQPTPEYIR